MPMPLALTPDVLCQRCTPKSFDFKDTSELEALHDIIGQDRAVKAICFGISIQRRGYHIFAHGPVGSGKSTTVRHFLRNEAQSGKAPSDWCYVHNPEKSYQPIALELPCGTGPAFKAAMDSLVEELIVSIPSLMDEESSTEKRKAAMAEFETRSRENYERLQAWAEKEGVAIVQGNQGMNLAPKTEEGVLSREQFAELSEERQTEIRETLAAGQEQLDLAARTERQIQREVITALTALDRAIASEEISERMSDLHSNYAELPAVQKYLERTQADILDHLELFQPEETDENGDATDAHGTDGDVVAAAKARRREDPRLRRFAVNVLISNEADAGVPMVFERYPSLANLVGRIEHEQRMGALSTDFTLIKPGAFHRANGGYLVIEAEELIKQPFSWDATKRALRHEEIRIENPGEDHSPMTTITLDPEPINLNCKVILLGTTGLYFGMHEADSDLADLFKVGAEFAASMPRTSENEFLYARFIASVVSREDMLHLSRDAVSRVIEHSSRVADDSARLTTYFLDVTDLLREADFYAREAEHSIIERSDIEEAIDARVQRNDLSRDRVLESFERKIMHLDLDGEAVGQVNALTVLTRGDFRFGMPSRITASVRLGSGKVIDIEREVHLSGPFHSKGVLILSGYLSNRFVPENELAIAASLTFEQSYNAVDGDSASSTELYALLSSLSGLPIKQCYAVTGSVDQRGRIQAIGGVNEKIEGFFDVCHQQGLNGEQGVLIPASNVQHLMLRSDVVEAVEEGKFHVYPIATIDEGISLLTGVDAGEQDEEGNFPPESVNGLVQARLERHAKRWQQRQQPNPIA